MTADWSASLPALLWQVVLHASIMGFIFYAWAHRVSLPSGKTKRTLLGMLLILPLVTAAIPGRATVEFGEYTAWFNSARILSVSLPAGFRVYDVVVLVALLSVVLTVWQELLPALRRPKTCTDEVPETLQRLARALPGWARCVVVLSPLETIMLATGGWPPRPRLIVSRGAIVSLTDSELAVVVAHENAHWQAGRWLTSHLLFVVRLLQCFNPVALWVFREYCLEVEINCDAVAVTGRDPRTLARVLLKVYRSIGRRDVAARGALRKRVDVLLEGGPQDAVLPTSTIVAAAGIMLVVLPWIV